MQLCATTYSSEPRSKFHNIEKYENKPSQAKPTRLHRGTFRQGEQNKSREQVSYLEALSVPVEYDDDMVPSYLSHVNFWSMTDALGDVECL